VENPTDLLDQGLRAAAPRKVFVLTGKRGGFGALKPMLRLMQQDPDFDLQLVVTDQHVSGRFGHTLSEVEADFRVSAAVDMEQANDRPVSRARALGTCLREMSDVLARLRPDLCVLYGDRGEVLATATAATILNIPIAHIQGGDISGAHDETMRHAVTKLAHLHFPSTSDSAQRIHRMGEEEWRVHVVGDSHLDAILAKEYCAPADVARALALDLDHPVIIVLQHSDPTVSDGAYGQMAATLEAVRDTGHQAVAIYPCSDAGYLGIIRAIDDLATPPQFRVKINLDAPLFRGLMATAAVLVGNSSAGLIETPCFGLPAVNIGRRQLGRLNSDNVLHVDYDRAAIRGAIDLALSDGFRDKAARAPNPYGDGHAGERIVDVLRRVPLDQRLLLKRMAY